MDYYGLHSKKYTMDLHMDYYGLHSKKYFFRKINFLCPSEH